MPQPWRTVRIFISSTFRDMQAERDRLVRFVFPELRERCAKRRLHLIDVDLRWGVTEKEAEEGKVLDVCLDEIERCQPFFVGLLGERYGSVPPKYEVPDEPRYDWLRAFEAGHSITALEIYHGVLRNPQMARRAFFYFRDPKFIDSVPGEQRDRFLPASEEERQKLLRLKQEIQSRCKVTHYAAPDDHFEKQVLEELWAAIQAEHPEEEQEAQDDLAIEQAYHEAFIEERSRSFVGRIDLLNELHRYADGNDDAPLPVIGEPGSGKSALLAKFASDYSAANPDTIVLSHFIGISPTSTDMRLSLRRLCREVAGRFSIAEDIPEKYEDLRVVFPQLLEKAAANGRLLLILDALNQFDTTSWGADLSWFPTRLPEGVRAIVSSIPGEWARELRRRLPEVSVLTVGALADRDRREIVRQTLDQYRKHLADEPRRNEMGTLLDKREADKPLYLAVACEELRVFGEFEHVSQRIREMAEDVAGLFAQVLARLEHDHGEWLIRGALSLLACSRHGLLESELLELLKREREVQLPRAIWARAYRSLRFYLRPPGEEQEGELGFFHQQLQKAVERKYLADPEAQVTHRRLALYFRGKGDPKGDETWEGSYPRAMSELPYQLAHCDADTEFEKLLMTYRFLQAKLEAFGPEPLIADYDLRRRDSGASTDDSRGPDVLRLIQGALRLSAHVIGRDPGQFASQLVGRLLPHLDMAAIELFTAQLIEGTRKLWLRPLQPTLHPPGTSLVRTLHGHTSVVLRVVMSGDGRLAVSASADHTLKVWEVESGRDLYTLEGHTRWVKGVAMSGDGRLAVSASADHTLKVWEVASGRELRTLKGHSSGVNGVALDMDGRLAVSASDDNTLKVWEVESGRELRTLRGHRSPDPELVGPWHAYVLSVAMSGDGRLAVSASNDNTLKVWEVESGRELRTLRGHAGAVHDVALSRDGRLAVSAGLDSTLRVWDVESGRELRILKGHSSFVNGVALSADGRLTVSASSDSTLKIWEAESGHELGTLEGHSDTVNGVALSGNGRLMVSASSDDTLKVWEVESGRELRTSRAHSGDVRGAAMNGDERRGSVNGVALSADGRLAVSASSDWTLTVWDVASGRELRTLKGHRGSVNGVALSADGRLAVSASSDWTLMVWDVGSGHELRKLEGHFPYAVHAVALSRDGRLAVSSAQDKRLKVWEVGSGHELRTLEGHSDTVARVALSGDGRVAVSTSHDKTLKVWDVESGRELRTVEGHSGAVALSEDRLLAISASVDHNTLKVWEVESGHELRTLEGHSDTVSGVALNGDGRVAVSTSHDKTLKVWEVASGVLLATFTCDAAALCCAFINDRHVIAGDAGGRIHFLELMQKR